ncbi:hypothetical protein [Undibacterium sp. RuTC16W]|uniref:hypothetical protein n=1 Tax=Undibacterium sp. RuTC16W TaxID=3413048 RepID=UPI003BF15083
MRVKLEGEVTFELLAQALIAAKAAQGPDFSGFIGGSLYINVSGKGGKRYSDHSPEQSLVMTVPFNKNEYNPLVMGLAARQDIEEYYLDIESQFICDIAEREKEKARQAEDRKFRDAMRRKQHRRELTFLALFKKYGNDLIESLNAAIRETWQESCPAYTSNIQGRHTKGDLRPVPYLEHDGYQLYLHRDQTGKHYLKIGTPISKYNQEASEKGYLVPHGVCPEWAAFVVPRMNSIIESYIAKSKVNPDGI